MTAIAAMDLGEARRAAIDSLTQFLDGEPAIEKAVLGQDLFGVLRVILWLSPGAEEERLRSEIAEALAPCGRYWEGEIWVSNEETSHADDRVYAMAWDDGIEVPDVERLRIDDRTRTRTAWLPRFREPVWVVRQDSRAPGPGAMEGPPVVVFYSFKGGVGRTTALAAFAIERARSGQRVLVMDMDLDAPGAGMLLSADEPSPARGVVDYLIDSPLGEVEIRDYAHRCRRRPLVGDNDGEIVVMSAGRVDESYLMKLARLDLEIRGRYHPLEHVLHAAREEFKPDWILIDSRAGLSPSAGLLLDGIAHLHVLFGTSSTQSQLGLTQVIKTLGEQRLRRGHSQANCVVVHAMVVDNVEVEEKARIQFQEWLEQTMADSYFVKLRKEEDAQGDAGDVGEPEDDDWSIRDAGHEHAPDRSIGIPYRQRFAFFPSIDRVAPDLLVGPYEELASRILLQFRMEKLSESKGS